MTLRKNDAKDCVGVERCLFSKLVWMSQPLLLCGDLTKRALSKITEKNTGMESYVTIKTFYRVIESEASSVKQQLSHFIAPPSAELRKS